MKSLLKSYIDITNDDEIEQAHKNEVIEAIFLLNKELMQEDFDQEFKTHFHEAVLNLPYDILEKLSDPFHTGYLILLHNPYNKHIIKWHI